VPQFQSRISTSLTDVTALPGTVRNTRLKQSHGFGCLLLGRADMRVVVSLAIVWHAGPFDSFRVFEVANGFREHAPMRLFDYDDRRLERFPIG